MPDIDTKLTTIENLVALADVVNVIVLRKTHVGWGVGTASVTDADEAKAANNQPLESLLCEGVPHDIEFTLESVSGDTIQDAVLAAFLRCCVLNGVETT